MEERLAEFLIVCGVSLGTINAATALACGAMALVLIGFQRKILKEQRWPFYLGMAFSIFSIQYLLRWLINFLLSWHKLSPALAAFFENSVQVLGSTGNNLFLLAAALLLLGMRLRYLWWFASGAVLIILCHLLGLSTEWGDATFSLATLSLLGWALFLNIRLGRRWRLATAALLTGIIYGSLNFVYAAVPYITTHLNKSTANAIDSEIKGASALLSPSPKSQEDILKARGEVFKASIFAIAVVLKFSLFSLALVPILRALGMLRPATFRDTLDGIIRGNSEFFGNKGIVRAIGKSFEADIAQICLRVPGSEMRRVLYWQWRGDQESDEEPPDAPFVQGMPLASESLIGEMLTEDKIIKIGDFRENAEARKRYKSPWESRALLAVPIRYHGAIIGGLILEWRNSMVLTDTLVNQIQHLANIMSAGLQSERQLSALDQCGYRLPRLELHPPGKGNIISKRIDIVHDTMSPLATAIHLELGFRSVFAGCTDDQCFLDHALTMEEERDKGFSRKTLHSLLGISAEDARQKIELRRERLVINQITLGAMLIAYPKQAIPDRPMLGANYLHRRTIVSLVADELLDSMHHELAAILADLNIKLNSPESDTMEGWYDALNRAVKASGLLWLVARGRPDLYQGYKGYVKLVRDRDLKPSVDAAGSNRIAMASHPLGQPWGTTRHVVAIQLPVTGAQLWCGVLRRNFGEELTFASPWQLFLDRLGEAADAALLRITAARDLKRATLDSSRQQGLTTAVITVGTLTHQVLNFANGFTSGLQIIDRYIRLGKIQTPLEVREIIESMGKSAAELRELLRPLNAATALDEHRPCSLVGAIDSARRLHESILQQRSIAFQIECGTKNDFLIDLPFQVLALALANLITNAVDAMDSSGKGTGIFISFIEVEKSNSVECAVRDDGPGINQDVGDVFKPGVTTKDGSGGWGLYLTQRSLLENHANIKITETSSEGTEFTLCLPKSKQESME